MRKWAFILFMVFTLLLPLPAAGQDPVTLSSLQVQIWPEYDQPSALVIYNLFLPVDTAFPVSLSVRIPVTAGDPNAVAARQPDGSLYSIDRTREVSGDWATIDFTTTASEVQLEYYDPGLQKDGPSRHYKYTWPGDYAVTQFSISVQQPSGATDMRLSPSLGAGTTGQDGLTYYTQDIGSIPAGQTFDITVDYQKSSDALSVVDQPVEPSASIPQSSTPDLNFSTLLPWILGILGAGLIIGGIVWYWQTGRQRPVAEGRRRRSRAGSSEAETLQGSSEDAIYCSQCGKRASPGDLFCRYCGTQIQTK
ncbi:MAG: zinc ribbon domain-containing protein [Acidobacteriaceae bacterium]